MSLEALYQEVIIEHYRRPQNRGELPNPTASVQLDNPLCGDEITLDLLVEDGVIVDVRFRGQGCSISQASASMMTQAVKGKTVAEADALMQRVQQMLKGEASAGPDLGDLEALQGVAKFPVRIKCALLAWEALDKGVHASGRAEA